MRTEAERRLAVEMLCRGMPKTKVYPTTKMARNTFNKHLLQLCKDALLPTDVRIWHINREAIMRNYDKYEKYLKDRDKLFVSFRRSLEAADVYRGSKSVEDFSKVRGDNGIDDDILA